MAWSLFQPQLMALIIESMARGKAAGEDGATTECWQCAQFEVPAQLALGFFDYFVMATRAACGRKPGRP